MDECCWGVVAVLLLLPILYEFSTTFRYWTKFFFYYLITMIVGIVLVPICLVRPKNIDNYRFIRFLLKTSLKLFNIKTEVRGGEHLQTDKPYIIVCNHQSSLDLIGMMDIWPDRCTTIAKKVLKFAGPFGLTAYLSGTIFIDRLNHERAKGTMDETAKKIKNDKIKVWIFPEGTRNNDGAMLPFKKGAFHLAVQAQIPVMPVVFSSYSGFLSKKPRKFGTGKVIITCLPPVSTDGLNSSDVSELTEKIRNSMVDAFNNTSSEVSPQAASPDAK
ncbi:1-acyl-sn-glycerol-3-phosphate acyltransferase alpha-like [Tubulanus polymorphus]|uniref:1-acyl-sn-glycerol-3-phosphate acyltransferase alpha-like n=1 Tax=Tubulanus polymorphus TaxID=672921 RepID=UPI003DA54387